MKKTGVLYVDLLYKKNGSFDRDYLNVSNALSNAVFDYWKFPGFSDLLNVMILILRLSKKTHTKVVIASARTWQIVLIGRFSNVKELFHIIHFLPTGKRYLHVKMLRNAQKYFKYAVLTEGVRSHLEEFNIHAQLIGVRYYDKKVSRRGLRLVSEKISAGDSLNIFMPGVKSGVRRMLAHNELEALCSANNVVKLCIQVKDDKVCIPDSDKIQIVNDLSETEYNRKFEEADLVIMLFDKEYELRSSAMIFDALSHGCVIWTESHPIVDQYGFPKYYMNHINENSNSKDMDILPGYNAEELGQAWSTYLK